MSASADVEQLGEALRLRSRFPLGDFGNLVLLCDRCAFRYHPYGFGDPCLCARVCGRATHALPS